MTRYLDLSNVTWVQNGSFSESQPAGASYSKVFAGNGSGGRIASDLISIPDMPLTVQIVTGFDVAACLFDSNNEYIGYQKGYAIRWETTGLEFTIDEPTAAKIAFILKRNTGTLNAADWAETGLSVSYEGGRS